VYAEDAWTWGPVPQATLSVRGKFQRGREAHPAHSNTIPLARGRKETWGSLHIGFPIPSLAELFPSGVFDSAQLPCGVTAALRCAEEPTLDVTMTRPSEVTHWMVIRSLSNLCD
jgi:hypothetical protein